MKTLIWIIVVIVTILIIAFNLPFDRWEREAQEKENLKIQELLEKKELSELRSNSGRDYNISDTSVIHRYVDRGYTLDIDTYGETILLSVDRKNYYDFNSGDDINYHQYGKQFWIKAPKNKKMKITLFIRRAN